jgi:AbiV family abortive infection protein
MKQTPASYHQGYILALANSNSLLKIADNAAAVQEYGIACSLSILSAEEAIKACFYLHKHHYPDMEYNAKHFTSHSKKHEHIENHLIAFVYIPTRLMRILEKENFKGDSTFCSFLANFLTKQDDDFSQPGDLKSKEIREWPKKANQKKNDGLYVGIHENASWHNPRDTSQQEYEDERRFSSQMNELAEKFDVFHSKWKASLAKKV